MSETRRMHANPFHNLPEDKMAIIRGDFYENNNSKKITFEQHLESLHRDDVIPEEVLDVIEGEGKKGEVVTGEEFLEWLHKDD